MECIVRGSEADMDTGNDDEQGGSTDKETKIHDGKGTTKARTLCNTDAPDIKNNSI